VSRARARWLLGSARLSLWRLFADLRGRLARRPPAAGIVPTPRVARNAKPMRLTHVVVSSDLNPRYLACWRLTADTWRRIAGLEPVLVLIASETEVPAELRGDPGVRVVEPLPGLHTALQAQCIRLLYPALIETGGGAVLTSDIDMAPLNRGYFHRPASRIDERHFLAYRDVLLPGMEIPICYNAAIPRVWGEIFAVSSLDDVQARLVEWGTGLRYEGVRGREGWDTDQVVLHRVLVDRGRTHGDVWILDDRYTGHRRLLQSYVGEHGLEPAVRRSVARGGFSDFHYLHPYEQHRELNESIVDLAARSRRR
jgi:hypothetical protein